MTCVREIHARDFEAIRMPLADLLHDAVEHGASVGFVLPMAEGEALAWVDSLRASVEKGQRLIWVAERDNRVCGSVQLDLCMRANGINRAEVQKLLVHSQARRLGIARTLMLEVEARAKQIARGLLYLDTEADSPAESFYRNLGYARIGGLPEYACSPQGVWRSNSIYFKTLFRRNLA